MNPPDSPIDLTAIILSAQRGSVEAAGTIVELYQAELLGLAYLLTGDRSAAQHLAGGVFERAFSRLGRFDPEDEFYPWLLRHIPAAIQNDIANLSSRRFAFAAYRESGATGYQVDDDRSRMRHALELIAPHDRLLLVLSDYVGVSPAVAIDIVGLLSDEESGRRKLDETRKRVRLLASIPDGQPVAAGLRALAVDAPRTSLRDVLEPVIEWRFSQQRRRSRLLAIGAIAIVLGGLSILGMVLFLGGLGADNSGSSGAGQRPNPAAVAEPASPTAQHAVELPAYEPVGNVPGRLILQDIGSLDGDGWGIYDPSTDRSPIELPDGKLAGISPDGGMLLLIREERQSDGVDITLIGASSASGEEQWRTDVGPLAESGPNSIYYDLVVVDDLVYVATHDRGYKANVLTIVVVRLNDGCQRDIWGLNLGVEISRPGLTVDLLGTIEPAAPLLTIHLRNRVDGWLKIHQIDPRTGLATIDSDLIDTTGTSLGRRILAPDGRAAIVIPPNGLAARPAVSYILFDTMAQGAVEIPFESVESLGGVMITYVLSHDGRWLYAIDLYKRQVAIVSLERLQVERYFDLESVDVPPLSEADLGPGALSNQRPGTTSAISADGRYLVVLSPARDIWTIDTHRWSMSMLEIPDSPLPVESVFGAGSDSGVYLHSNDPIGEDRDAFWTLLADPVAGEIISAVSIPENVRVTGTLAGLYRQSYGRSPAVEGVAPNDNRELTTLPMVEVEIEPRLARIDEPVELKVTLLDPGTGESLEGVERTDLRSPDPDLILATFTNGPERRTAILGRGVDGSFGGLIDFDLPGPWLVDLSVEDPDGEGWAVSRSSPIDVVDVITVPDRQDYVLEISADHDQLRAGWLVDLTIRFVGINQDPTSFYNPALDALLPSPLTMSFPDGTTSLFFRSGTAVFTGYARFPAAGVAFPTLTFTTTDGTPTVFTFRVEVGPSG